jgi:pimeloyl-ACP methyl ester carboxylesterase
VKGKFGRETMKKLSHAGHRYGEKAILERTRWIPRQEKLLYWGLSYGTSIGTIFAAMYPEKVGRIVLDGVDVPPYYNLTHKPGIRDADKVLDRLLLHCFDSGSIENCGLSTLLARKPSKRYSSQYSIMLNRILLLSAHRAHEVLRSSHFRTLTIFFI